MPREIEILKWYSEIEIKENNNQNPTKATIIILLTFRTTSKKFLFSIKVNFRHVSLNAYNLIFYV